MRSHAGIAHRHVGAGLRARARADVIHPARFLLVLGLLAACSEAPAPEPTPAAYWPTEAWRTSTPEAQGMDSEELLAMLDFIQEGEHNIHSVVIVRNGYLVLDAHWYPFNGEIRHELRSGSKSVVSALIGIAIDEGYIEGIDQPVLDFFPERTIANLDALKEAMAVEDLLTMRSGFDVTMLTVPEEPDWTQVALDQPMAHAPGTYFYYNPSVTYLLSAIIQNATGMTTLEFARQRLFEPLGISDAYWQSDPMGIALGFSGLSLTPHDMARIGYLYLNEGIWEGEQIVPSEWVEESTRVHVSANDPAEWWPDGGADGYGYQWWVRDSGIYSAEGYGAQRIYVIPDLEMVVVLTAALHANDYETPNALLDYAIESVESSGPLPEHPEAAEQLAARVRALAQPEPEPVPPLPELAEGISNQRYRLGANTLRLYSFRLHFQGEEALMTLSFEDGESLDLPIGLDNVYRITPDVERFTSLFEGIGAPNPIALRGGWTDQTTFVFQIVNLGAPEYYTFIIVFSDGLVSIGIAESVSGWTEIVRGWNEE
jgi:CubicO group peptidase (beta-lactamase class C family)